MAYFSAPIDTMMVNGRADEVDPHFKEAFRLSPRDPFAFAWVATQAVRRGGGRA